MFVFIQFHFPLGHAIVLKQPRRWIGPATYMIIECLFAKLNSNFNFNFTLSFELS